jgi:hypothetical protein
MGDLMTDTCGDIGRAFQPSADLQRRDAPLVVGKPPDAAIGLEQPDEEQAGNRRMHHPQIQRRRLGHVPVGDLLGQEREAGAKAGPQDDGVEFFPCAVGEVDGGSVEALDAVARDEPAVA